MSSCKWLAVVCISAALLGISCRPGHGSRIVIGSKNFTEQLILGELLAQQIEHRTGLSVERRFYLAGTYICHQALLAGRIDMYVEYTGTALTAILHQRPSGDHADVYRRVKDGYPQRFGLAVGEPLGFNNTFAIVIRGEDARRLHIQTISQAVSVAQEWRAGFGYEFMERPDGYAGLTSTYGLHFAQSPRIMDLGLLYRALRDNQVDLVAGAMTDGLISALDLVVLDDDRHYFPPYDAVPVVRREVIERPEVRAALTELGGKISEADMRSLNYALDGEHRDVANVVADFRKQKGLQQ
jgi:osmoprotectant transport system substrate-binding protein